MTRRSLTTISTLLRRELWESPVAFMWTPLGIALLILAFVVFSLILGGRFDAEMAYTSDMLKMLAEQPDQQRRLIVSGMLFWISAIFFQLMLLIILFYLAGSLFDDRKDRSILFWKSLPVSDCMTVASKLAAACLLVPALFFLAIVLTHLVLLLIATGYSLVAGVNPWTTIWAPATLPRLWSVMLLGLVVQAVWLLPVYAWLLFCSSWAPRLPLLIAIAIPAGLALTQHAWTLITRFGLPEFNIGLIMLKRLGSGTLPMSANVQFDGGFDSIEFSDELFMSFSTTLGHLAKLETWVGVAIALVLLWGAVWFRRRATDG
ncbi:MAG: hypothetical protein JJU31_05985 [Wenzhouxiangella sp.]|nr:hypothetical protein [Wenzhouxiangella sp.]TVR98005.1 MAG: hypothetical protein EA418_02415 [Wenzhouxiangellaceae bacterium]